MQSAKSFLIIAILLICQNILAQNYTHPFDFNLYLSGTFGELRSNHFHAGIDIKTEGVEGQKVRAIADGYISRIKASSFGYGKVIYIDHPETGHTSVYAHLQKFNKKINDVIKKKQYEKESFEIDLYLNKNEIQIKQGEIIALSGNSGSSNGAHLHFEIRETKTQHPINPLQFNFKIKDDIPPILKKIKMHVYDTTTINGYNEDITYNIKKKNNTYYLEDIPEINGGFSLGLFTYDKSNYSYNKNGVYSIKMYIDSILHYEFKVDKLDFNTSRYINAHIDYCELKENKTKYHRCHKLPNNKLNLYPIILNDGVINFQDDSIHFIKIEVSDIYNNTSILNFEIKSKNNPFLMKCPAIKDTISTNFKLSQTNRFYKEDFKLSMPPFALYEDLKFRYNTTDSIEEIYGKVHHVHFNNTPVHKKYSLEIKTNIADSLIEKTYIATTDMKGNFWYIGGIWKNNFLKTETREFGNFCIVADTTNPEIKGVNIFPGKKFNTQTTIKLTIKDKESGIKSYRGEIDGKWILMEYDHKRNLLRFDIENNISKGDHIFTLEVIDKVGNTTNYKAKFTY